MGTLPRKAGQGGACRATHEPPHRQADPGAGRRHRPELVVVVAVQQALPGASPPCH